MKNGLLVIFAIYLLNACSQNESALDANSEQNNYIVNNEMILTDMPELDNISEYSEGKDFTYFSSEYINFIKITKNHPNSIREAQKNGIPSILAFNNSEDKLIEIWNYHEGGTIIESIYEFNNLIEYKGTQFNRENFNVNDKAAVSKYIANLIFENKVYNNNIYELKIVDGIITLNDIEYLVKADIGGGYNSLQYTMITIINNELQCEKMFALKFVEEGLILITLKYNDNPVAIPTGEELELVIKE